MDVLRNSDYWFQQLLQPWRSFAFAALGTGWRMALAPAAAKAQLCWLEFVDYLSLILQGKWLSNLLTTSQRNKFITRSIFDSLKKSHFTGSR